MSSLVAIDPGLKFVGWAWGNDELEGAGVVERPHPKSSPWEMAEFCLHFIPSADRAVVECMVKYPGDSVDANDLLRIQLVGGLLAGALPWKAQRQLAQIQASGVGLKIGQTVASLYSAVTPRDWKGQTPKPIMFERIRGKLRRDEQKVLDECLADVAISKREHALDAVGIWLDAQGRMKRGV